MNYGKTMEKRIKGKLMAIESAKTKDEGLEIIKEAEINNKLEILKKYDEAEAEVLRARYLKAVKENSEK